jgi:hypothetical protein
VRQFPDVGVELAEKPSVTTTFWPGEVVVTDNPCATLWRPG